MSCLLQSRRAKVWALLTGILLLLVSMLMSILFGYHMFTFHMLLDMLYQFDGSKEHLLLRDVRLPAAFIAASVGASLAIAGVLMQNLTKNPLASPSLFGINAGAVLFIVLTLFFFDSDLTLTQMVWIAFVGAGVTAVLVLILGTMGKDGFLPIKVTLAGAAVSVFASSFTSGIMLINNESLNQALFWLVGSVTGRKMEHLTTVLPYMVIGWIIALCLSHALNLMAMGDDMAKGLGLHTAFAKLLIILVVILLAGGSVSLAGPIAFVGLIVPHICRYIVGVDHKWLIPFSGLIGAILLVSADTASRFLLMPKEVPVGVATALLGVPFLIYIARRSSYE
ncbi:iron ABC transporter permease [Brevibacillus laterosporus]|uniref:Putative siderophore transport system permease protein YfiZ n=1 Tax=Brevibacillus laterosporus LMG 15441 TaxID=1042163 RepID=A0A075R1S3_BRELA|nr:iron ABC transporter permease [Brevibacillus laterosporus]WPS88905.1 iron ABC transporter permease [Brevibacillus halotolerans]AIG25366.1 putative siderophore transport system permease protein YfiZ precursor [Brevibacillus laterosporus LMG 15441]AUM63932.1 iron ABC transporter permease [Brevibacillus laterosporus]ERM17975.1 siderophore ABC transporter permease [Brevibacillus laterosporus PE36]PCN44959.1 iron ABC transporter [Brevibacillus laterosporus]